METSANIKEQKVRMSEVEDQVQGMIWIVSDKIDP
jgi:hypothetical protein